MLDFPDRTINVNMRELAMCTLLQEDGVRISIRSLWEKQPAIFIFLRHFACEACRVHAMEVWEKRDAYQSKGAKIHFIGNGTKESMKDFKEQFGLKEASFFTDPELKSFKAAGFKKGFWISPGKMHSRVEFLTLVLRHSKEIKASGAGNIWQLGGVLAVKPGGAATYQFTSQAMGDFPPSGDIKLISG